MRRTAGLLVIMGVVVGLGAVGCSSSSPSAGPAPTATAASGPELGRYRFASGDDAARLETVDVLNHRFEVAGMAAHAELDDPALVIRSTGGPPPSLTELTVLVQAGSLHFRPVVSDEPCEVVPATDTTVASSTDEHLTTEATLTKVDGNGSTVASWCVAPAVLDNGVIESVTAGTNARGAWELRPVLKAGADGIDAFNVVAASCSPPSRTCPTGELAVTVDGHVLIAPTIQATTFERDQITISGDFDQEHAVALAAVLDAGPLPAPLALPAN